MKPGPKPRRYRPVIILYHGNNTLDGTVTFSVDGTRYEYWLAPGEYLGVIEHLAHKISLGKALAFAKKHAIKTAMVAA
jgi:hypothetical protein